MASLARAIAVLGTVSIIGTVTQVAKGKLGAIFLGLEGVAILAQLTTLYSLCFVIAGLGFFNGIIRTVSLGVNEGRDDDVRAQLNSVTLFLGIVSMAVTGLAIALSGWISDLLFADDGAKAPFVTIAVLAVPIAVQQRVFRAHLNARRDLRGISRAQLTADVTSVALFAAGTWIYGVWGGIFSFIFMHAMLLAGMMYYSVKIGGKGLVLPQLKRFHWADIRSNFGYGVNGLIMTSVASGTVIVVTRSIIDIFDMAMAGIFAVAFKVATVYLGALYAAAGSYYFPTLIRIEKTNELEAEVNRAVALYMTILPPIIIGLIAAADILIPLLFSAEFGPAVTLMSVLLFADIFRVASETTGLALLAREKLVGYTGLYLVYAAGFIGLTLVWLPEFGLIGVGFAYLVMRIFDFFSVLIVCKSVLQISLNRIGLYPLFFAILAVGVMTVAEIQGVTTPFKIALAILTGAIWMTLSWRLLEFQKLKLVAFRKLNLQ